MEIVYLAKRLNFSKIIPFIKNTFKLIIDAPLAYFPKFPYMFFYLSTFISMSLTIALSYFTDKLNIELLTSSWSEQLKVTLAKLFQTIYLDPITILFISGLFCTFLAYKIFQDMKPSPKLTFYVSFFPWFFLFMSFVLEIIIFKPAFNYQRPEFYSIQNEPPIMKLFFSLFGSGKSAPSGTIIRQVIVTMTIILLNTHPNSLFKNKKTMRWMINIIALFLIFLVGFGRVIIQAHTIFDVIFGIACGSMIFWLIYIIPYDYLHKNGALSAVISIFLLFIGVFLFYAKSPAQWIVKSFSILLILLLLDLQPILLKLYKSLITWNKEGK